jgi:hypothetical protein
VGRDGFGGRGARVAALSALCVRVCVVVRQGGGRKDGAENRGERKSVRHRHKMAEAERISRPFHTSTHTERETMGGRERESKREGSLCERADFTLRRGRPAHASRPLADVATGEVRDPWSSPVSTQCGGGQGTSLSLAVTGPHYCVISNFLCHEEETLGFCWVTQGLVCSVQLLSMVVMLLGRQVWQR